METPSDRKSDSAGTTDRGASRGNDGSRHPFAPTSNGVGASSAETGLHGWSSALNLMLWGQDQVERTTRIWFDQAYISTKQSTPASSDVVIEERQVQVGALTAQYLTAGEGPPLVLLHGDGHSARSWLWAMPALAREHRVYAPFLPGFGITPNPADYSPTFFAGFVREFLDTLGIEQATVVGNSYGGLVALHLALSNPQRVMALGLVDSAGLGREINAALAALALPGLGQTAINLTRTPVGTAQRVWLYVTLQFWRSERVPKEWLEEQYEVPMVPGFLEATVGVKQAVLGPIGQLDVLLDEVPRLTMPTLVMWGVNDLVFPVHHAHAAVARLPKGQLALIPDCGHLPHLERPDRFVAALGEFLAEHGLGAESRQPDVRKRT
ncbi:MAG: alpha/beta fold hydrolase [Chloroflexota bacterium]|nr:alpha/beta fold hydrolase [Chloroflexota bacterium]